jgi:hypothetical protein
VELGLQAYGGVELGLQAYGGVELGLQAYGGVELGLVHTFGFRPAGRFLLSPDKVVEYRKVYAYSHNPVI